MASCSEICGSEYQSASAANGGNQYGVRSYLHQFYEECAGSLWDREADFQTQRSPSRWSSVLWKVCVILGGMLMLAGLVVLFVGYATKPRIEAFGEDELLFVDERAVHFNRALDACKLAGAVLFCVGGAGMALGLLLAVFTQASVSKEEQQLQQRFRDRLAELQSAIHPVTRAPGGSTSSTTGVVAAPTPGEAKVPVTLSRVQSVQPGTGSGT